MKHGPKVEERAGINVARRKNGRKALLQLPPGSGNARGGNPRTRRRRSRQTLQRRSRRTPEAVSGQGGQQGSLGATK